MTVAKYQHTRFQNLDALRFAAALAVVIFHFSRDIRAFMPDLEFNSVLSLLFSVADKGALGVNFFFVLSGFLITFLILEEHKHTGRFHLGKFLLRRTLRIWPLYFIIVLLGFVLFPFIWNDFETTHHVGNYVIFLANFDEIWYGANDPVNFLTSPWSIAVEEQFYLFWGIAMFLLFLSKKIQPEILLLVLTLACMVFRLVHLDEENVLYYHTLSVCQDLLTGCFFGISLLRNRQWITRLISLNRASILMIYLAGIAICLLKNKIFVEEIFVFERLVLSLFFAFVILEQSSGKKRIFNAENLPGFTRGGKISYGIYMYHLVVMYVLVMYIENLGWTGYWLLPVYLASSVSLSIFVATLSYYFLEQPLLKLKPH